MLLNEMPCLTTFIFDILMYDDPMEYPKTQMCYDFITQFSGYEILFFLRMKI